MSTDNNIAYTATPLDSDYFNSQAILPHGLTIDHVRLAMQDFLNFISFINQQLVTQGIQRLEDIVMPANFSSVVGEFVKAGISRHCPMLVQNRYHNGHPDLLPTNLYLNDAIQHGTEGLEVKASKYLRGWQGHNPEDTWLMVFVYDSSSSEKPIPDKPFHFRMVVGAYLNKEDWTFSGRSETSRRTITASVNRTGYEKMVANWIYREPNTINRRGRAALPSFPE